MPAVQSADLLTVRTLRDALEFGVAASALKHTIPGDFNLVSRADVEKSCWRRRKRPCSEIINNYKNCLHRLVQAFLLIKYKWQICIAQ